MKFPFELIALMACFIAYNEYNERLLLQKNVASEDNYYAIDFC